MMPGDKPFKTKELSHQLGIARLSFHGLQSGLNKNGACVIFMIRITMENGKTIDLELDAKAAPLTVENFLKLVGEGFFTTV